MLQVSIFLTVKKTNLAYAKSCLQKNMNQLIRVTEQETMTEDWMASIQMMHSKKTIESRQKTSQKSSYNWG